MPPVAAIDGPRLDVKLASYIVQNGDRIARLGQYIGLFEWALFAFFWGRDVRVHLGNTEIPLVQDYLPDLAHGHMERRAARGDDHIDRVLWGVFDGDLGVSVTGHRDNLRKVCHFEFLWPAVPAADEYSWDDDIEPLPAAAWTEQRGSITLQTAIDGNCGIDAMALLLGRKRKAATWLALRAELRQKIRQVCGQPA